MRSALLALGLLAAPLLPLAFSHPAGLERVRDWWLRGVALGSILLVPAFLAPIAAWWAWRWPELAAGADHSERAYLGFLGPLVIWVGIGLAWVLVAQVAPDWWPWIARGWVGWAAVLIARMVWRARAAGWRGFGQRQGSGWLGSPVMDAMYLALTAPFWPMWGWPWLAVGLWLTCSWAAFLALGMGALVYWVPWRG